MAKKITWPKLPKGFRTKWVKALRSGKYLQAKGGLYEAIDPSDDAIDPVYGFCCLGVACMIQGANSYDLSDNGVIGSSLNRSLDLRIPKVLVINDDDGEEEMTPLIKKLIAMNDGAVMNGKAIRKQSFKQIANWIEYNL